MMSHRFSVCLASEGWVNVVLVFPEGVGLPPELVNLENPPTVRGGYATFGIPECYVKRWRGKVKEAISSGSKSVKLEVLQWRFELDLWPGRLSLTSSSPNFESVTLESPNFSLEWLLGELERAFNSASV